MRQFSDKKKAEAYLALVKSKMSHIFCPLIKDNCVSHCACIRKPKLVESDSYGALPQYTVHEWQCLNAMLTGDRFHADQ